MQCEAPQCLFCKHFEIEGGWHCPGFSAQIPEAIIIGEHDHREPYAGDNGIRFTPIEGGE